MQFAALLNEKKQKIIKLERELARARGVAEPQAEEEDEEEDTEVVMEVAFLRSFPTCRHAR